MNLEYPWHEKTQEGVAKQVDIENPEILELIAKLNQLDKNKREAALYKLYLKAYESDPKRERSFIREVAAFLIIQSKNGHDYKLHAGRLLELTK